MGQRAAVIVALALAAGCGSERQQPLAPAAAEAQAAAQAEAESQTPTSVPATKAQLFAAAAKNAKGPMPRKRGGGKWHDAGVFVDGKELSVMWFGELPRDLEPVWLKRLESLDFKPGDKGPRERVIRQRRYRLSDYLRSLGVDIGAIKMLHVHGGGGHVAVIPGDVFRKWKRKLLFGFGGETQGKPIPIFPPGMPINTNFDRITAVAVYIDKPAPEIDSEFKPVLDGKRVDGIPYVGTPPRGGVRVYKNDHLVAIIKRRKLADSGIELREELDGHTSFALFGALGALGVDTSDVACGEVIFDERRTKILPRKTLADARVKAISGRSGLVQFPDGTEMQALALYTHKLRRPPPVVD